MILFGFVLTLFVWISYADWTPVPCTSPLWRTTGKTSWIAGDSTCGSTQLLSVDPDTGAHIELMFNGDGLQLCGGMDGDATAQIFLDNIKHENSIQTSGGPQCTYLATWSGLSPNTGHNLTIVVPSYPMSMGYPTASGTGMGFALDRALISTPDDEPSSSSVTTYVSTSAYIFGSHHVTRYARFCGSGDFDDFGLTCSLTAYPGQLNNNDVYLVIHCGCKLSKRRRRSFHEYYCVIHTRGAIIGASIASGIFASILVAVAIWLVRRYRSKGQPIVYEWTPGQTSEAPPAPAKAWRGEKGRPQPEDTSATMSPSSAGVAHGENVHIWTALARLQGEVHALRGGNEEPVPSYVSSPGTHRIQ
ncbi:hypothetical protein EXIGLDRAFT_781568 [Exidia glandulosa HHB12029]|uniref:Mannose 6-phosphate receptor domain-containing protein n=1 Tax=Exidia glandulosa HHB12029 TaxID=1314781 RepID=A0A165B756_EXIGL|nr:hypothetical protein EXIGLDRAFT_781568 [Exidia glandulosa HHB12029]